MANKKITELMAGTPTRDSLLESATDVGGTMVSRKFKVGAVADLNNVQIASEYDDTATYAYGAYCIKDGVLYRCTTAISVAEAWTSAHWAAVMVTGEYKRVRIMTKAQFDLLSNDEKDGFIYVSDYPTKIQDIDNVTLTTSDNNKLLGVNVSGSDISVGAVGGISTQSVDGVVWSIRQIGNWYEMWADITIDCSQITPSQWGGLYVYRNAKSTYKLPILLTKKVIDFGYPQGNIAMWPVYYTDLYNQENDRTTADIIRPTATNGTVVVHKYIKGYV